MNAVAKVGRALREALLTLAAIGGVICIVLTIMAFAGGFSLIMFKTGSMSPTIPAGSVALVQSIPASEIAIGDVTTVDRAGELPITHRIIGVSPGPTAETRVITMKGDANDSADPAPYTVSQVRIVRGSVPGLAYVIVWFGNPWVLGAITVAAALLVTWAFWPRSPRPETPDAEDATSAADDDPAAPEPSTRRERRLSRNVTSCIAIGALVALPTLGSAPAADAAGLVSIASNGGGTHALDPVIPYDWDLDIDARAAPDDGDLTITLRGEGQGLQLFTVARTCSMPWDASGCRGTTTEVDAARTLALDSTEQQLIRRATPSTVHLRISVTGSGAAGTATLTLRATAAQTSVEQTVGGTTLARTGGTSSGMLAAPAAVLVGLGAAFIVRVRRKKPR
ncbi:signal peptidase I [Microbacterium sp.]|uniref:signal peptidase I n=1 Tax=Microbacterium sp. TaxID=51671 RepID=UPI003C7259FD